MTTHRLPILPALGTLALTACAASTATDQPRAARPAPIVIDGWTTEWPASTNDLHPLADANHLYLRFNPSDPTHAIQAAPFSTRILLDTDNNPATGMPVFGLGVDASVTLSPPNNTGGVGIGSQVMLYNADGFGASAGHADLNFYCLPTFASGSYEARFDRDRLAGLPDAGPVAVRVDQVRPDGTVLWSAAGTFDLPPRPAESARPAAAMPAKPRNATRLLAQNVLYSSPLTNPDAFRRSITAINPDIILFQEWFNTPQAVIQNWVNTNLGAGWTVIAPNANEGVAIATRLPVLETVADLLPDSGPGRNARFIGAVIQTKSGPLFAASIHLKCCGGANSSEDTRRIQEAASINQTVAAVLDRHPGASVAIGGDYNLVGTRTPLDTLRAGLAADAGDLTPVETITLGEPAALTWVDDKSMFSPGRLDWVVVDAATTPIARAFTLDTRRLSDRALSDAGLERDDSHGSDHLPVVVDLLPNR